MKTLSEWVASACRLDYIHYVSIQNKNNLIKHKKNSSYNDSITLITIISVISYIFFDFVVDYLSITAIGLSFSLFIALRFINLLGKTFPLKELLVLMVTLQWIVGAKISYGYEDIHYKYFMYVEESVYMSLVVPATVLLYIGLLVFRIPNLKLMLSQVFENDMVDKIYMTRVASVLLFLGIFGAVLARVLDIASLFFIFFMLSLLIYVAIGYFLYLYPNKKNVIFLTALIITFLQALSVGLFHHFFLMAIFLFAIYVDNKKSLLWKTILITFAVILVNILQVVKADYRNIIWKSSSLNQSKFEIFSELVEEHFLGESTKEQSIYPSDGKPSENVSKVTTRINQGWIISKIMDYVPRHTDHLGGKSVSDAISASLLPRFLFPNKTSTEDALMVFEKVTGLTLIGGTSMGLSVVGEFYANYGIYGAWLAMFIYGLFISFFLKLLVRLSGNSPFFVLWLVVIFFQVIKAETYLIKVLNHLIKASIFVFVLHFGLRMFGINVFPKVKEAEN